MVSITVHGFVHVSKLSLWPLFNANVTDNVWNSTDFSFLTQSVFTATGDGDRCVRLSVGNGNVSAHCCLLKKPRGGGRERLGNTDVIQPYRVLQVMCWWGREGRAIQTAAHSQSRTRRLCITDHLYRLIWRTLHPRTHTHTHTQISASQCRLSKHQW